MAPKVKRILTVTISGYGGEHTIGSLTKEQAEYWSEKDDQDLEDHISSWHDVDPDLDEEHNIGVWHQNDDVDHTYGVFHNPIIQIKFGDDDVRVYSEDDSSLEEIPMNCDFELYAEGLDKDTHYLFCFSEEKGQHYWGEVKLKKSDVFNIEDFELITKDIFGKRFIVDVKYKGKLLNNNGSDAVGKGFDAEIINPADLLDE